MGIPMGIAMGLVVWNNSCELFVSCFLLGFGEETTTTTLKQVRADQGNNSETTQETTLKQLGGKQRRNNDARKQRWNNDRSKQPQNNEIRKQRWNNDNRKQRPNNEIRKQRWNNASGCELFPLREHVEETTKLQHRGNNSRTTHTTFFKQLRIYPWIYPYINGYMDIYHFQATTSHFQATSIHLWHGYPRISMTSHAEWNSPG